MDDDGGAALLMPYDKAMTMLGGIGRTTLYGLIGAGEIQRAKIGRRGFVTAKSVQAYVDRLSEAESVGGAA
jgi:hypothetical protein